MSPRTLQNWRQAAQKPPTPWGRPGHAPQARFKAHLQVARAFRQQGWTAGWRPIANALQGRVPLRLIHASVTQLKQHRRQRQDRRRQAIQVRVTVRASHTLIVQDATHCGRTPQGAIQAEIFKDRGTLATSVLAVGRPLTAAGQVQVFERMKQNGGLPLVWGTDNGLAYRSRAVEAYLVKEQVMHLRSQPHTPQNNGAAECAIGELKAEAALGKGVIVQSREEAARRLQEAAQRLTQGRRRATKGYQTSAMLANCLPCGYAVVRREVFYAQATAAIEATVHEGMSVRARRRAEREAIFRTLEQFGLVEITRGGQASSLVKPEGLT